MPINARDREAYRADEVRDHTLLSGQEKERMLKVRIPTTKCPPLLEAALDADPG